MFFVNNQHSYIAKRSNPLKDKISDSIALACSTQLWRKYNEVCLKSELYLKKRIDVMLGQILMINLEEQMHGTKKLLKEGTVREEELVAKNRAALALQATLETQIQNLTRQLNQSTQALHSKEEELDNRKQKARVVNRLRF